ncbi:MAG: DciA family protein [Vicinamibacterales bacterium]
MLPVQSILPGVVAEIVRRQPPSPERTRFAWTAVVGAAIARATTIETRGAVLIVSARDVRWAREIERNRDVILSRLQLLLGAGLTRLEIVSPNLSI